MMQQLQEHFLQNVFNWDPYNTTSIVATLVFTNRTFREFMMADLIRSSYFKGLLLFE
jgi:hypothetical protein